jgi:transcriptional regulator with XRE-family HTH domain
MATRLERPRPRIREWRLAKGLSQRKLAALSGVHFTSFQDWERDQMQPHPKNLKRLATALGVRPADLFLPPGLVKMGE